MVIQRRHGQPFELYRSKLITNSRGNQVWVADLDSEPIKGKGWVVPQRGARAEVPGQQDVQVVTLGTDIPLTDVDIWSLVKWRGHNWDVVAPAGYWHGMTRHVRHWTVDLRRRPNGG